MKLICLNTWSGRGGKEKLYDFFKKNQDVDIFCLQEMWEGGEDQAPLWGEGIDSRLVTSLTNILPGHTSFFHPHYLGFFGDAIFIKKDFKVLEEGDIFVYKERENMFDDDKAVNHARNLQYLKIETPNGVRVILNFHGLWNGISKEDFPERLIQSERIIKFLKGLSDPYVLCGDFNLEPHTKSLQMIEEVGLRNLIKEFNILTTRSSMYTKTSSRYADYTFVTPDITVNDFKVMPDEVSDHLALYLDFD